MAVVTKQRILEAIKERFGDDTSDETLALIEDVNDTLDDYENKTKDVTDWKTKYEDNDKAWREKYRARFYSATDEDEEEQEAEKETPKTYTYDELFKEDK